MSVSEKLSGASREKTLSALFAQLVSQQTNMAMMLLGKIANPQTGALMHNPEAAGFFIDQLEMLEAKTQGNLSAEETQLLKQSLATLRMAYVETVNTSAGAAPAPIAGEPGAPVGKEKPADAAPDSGGTSAGRKFSKKY